MVITCPACSTRFSLSDSAIGPNGRTVKCSRCGHSWLQMPPDSEFATPVPPPLPPSPAPDDEEPDFNFDGFNSGAGRGTEGDGFDDPFERGDRFPGSSFEPVRSEVAMAAAGHSSGLVRWVGLVLLISALGVAAFVGRGQVVALWTPAARLYEVLRIPVEPIGTGLQLQQVRSEQRMQDGASVVFIEGQVVNISQVARPVPPLRLVAMGQGRTPLHSWVIPANPPHLGPAEIAIFQYNLRDPGPVLEVLVTFDGA